MDLRDLGWNKHFREHFEKLETRDALPARIAREDRQSYLAYSERGPLRATPAGRLRHRAVSKADLPAVGDWVALKIQADSDTAIIFDLLPRSASFVRKVAGATTESQVVAANIDTVFLLTGLDHDFNIRRIERYLALAWESGAVPVIILNKADLCRERAARRDEVEKIAFGVPIHVTSALSDEGIEALSPYLQAGRTVAFLGSSGVGKSTIINHLLGFDAQDVGAVRTGDDRGRHTTTSRELLLIPGGGLVIDTPGMRELQLWGDTDTLKRTFDDIANLAEQCRFTDCSHEKEPGCAIREAIRSGSLEPARLHSYQKQQRELSWLALRQDHKDRRRAQKERGKEISRYVKELRRAQRPPTKR